jgi:hypothetical protein
LHDTGFIVCSIEDRLALFDTNQIHGLCLLLLYEKDEAKARELGKVLGEMLTSNIEETRSKIEFIAKHYPELALRVDRLPAAAVAFRVRLLRRVP